jgi:hypothetical protein
MLIALATLALLLGLVALGIGTLTLMLICEAQDEEMNLKDNEILELKRKLIETACR